MSQSRGASKHVRVPAKCPHSGTTFAIFRRVDMVQQALSHCQRCLDFAEGSRRNWTNHFHASGFWNLSFFFYCKDWQLCIKIHFRNFGIQQNVPTRPLTWQMDPEIKVELGKFPYKLVVIPKNLYKPCSHLAKDVQLSEFLRFVQMDVSENSGTPNHPF